MPYELRISRAVSVCCLHVVQTRLSCRLRRLQQVNEGTGSLTFAWFTSLPDKQPDTDRNQTDNTNSRGLYAMPSCRGYALPTAFTGLRG